MRDEMIKIYTPPREEGWTRHQEDGAKPPLTERTGWSITAKLFRSKAATPASVASRHFCYWRSHPSSRGGDYYLSPTLVVIMVLFCLALAYAQEAQRSVWDGVYNEEQSQRGRALFLDQCSNCHGRDLEGA